MVAVVAPATVAKPPHPSHPAHPAHPAHPPQGGAGANGACAALSQGYYARGELVSGTLSPGTKKDRYDGTLTVDVARANHRAATGTQTFTLTNARVRFGKGVDKSALAAGDRVVLHGKITALPHGCSTTGFSPTITVRYVRIRAAKAAKH
jgi:hypothetical protein